jgi:hypothetical protein
MARSGTSLTASIFVRKGYFGGESFPEPDRLNPAGYFEAEELVQRNSALIRSTGFPHDNSWVYRPMSPEQLRRLERISLGQDAREFVARFEQRSPWVWKDPRLCLLLRAWWPLLDAGNTAVLLVERDPDAIFESFVRAGWRAATREERLKTYERIRLHIESAKRAVAELGITALIINYADFAVDPAGTARRISEVFQLELGPGDLGYEKELNHDSAKGRIGTRIDRIATAMPAPLRRVIKLLTPSKLLRSLYPERFR